MSGGHVPRGGLAVGIGNSTVRVAVLEGTEVRRTAVFEHESVGSASMREALRVLLTGDADPAGVDWPAGVPWHAGICSVVPALAPRMEEMLTELGAEVRHCRSADVPWFPSLYRSMETLGADRFTAALGAREHYGAPVLVIDCGTATTISVVDREGRFLGGSIAPGVQTAFRALHERTAQLPSLEAGDAPLIGADTAESMRSGILQLGRIALEGAVEAIKKNTGDDTQVIATGGNLPLLLAAGLDIPGMRRDDDILFRGVIFYLHYTA